MSDQVLDDTANPDAVERGGGSRLEKAGYQLVEQLLKVGVNGIGPFKSARESAAEALNGRTQEEAVASLIRRHVAVAAGQGFVTNMGGFLTLPLTLPANVSAAYIIQTHLAASIAHVYDHEEDSEAVRTAILLCLVGNAGAEVVKKAGVTIGQKLAMSSIKKLPVSVIHKINGKVGFALVAKYGTKRATITLAKGVPFVGGAVGGSADAIATRVVGTYALRTFRIDDAGSAQPQA